MPCPHSTRSDARPESCSLCIVPTVERVIAPSILPVVVEPEQDARDVADAEPPPIPTERPDPETDRDAWLRWRASRAAAKRWKAVPKRKRSALLRAQWERTQR